MPTGIPAAQLRLWQRAAGRDGPIAGTVTVVFFLFVIEVNRYTRVTVSQEVRARYPGTRADPITSL